MQVRFTPLGKGTNRRSWHMLAQSPTGFKEWYQSSEDNQKLFAEFCENPVGFMSDLVTLGHKAVFEKE